MFLALIAFIHEMKLLNGIYETTPTAEFALGDRTSVNGEFRV